MRDIKFFVPTGRTIPTSLELDVDDTRVSYERIDGGFKFVVWEADTDKALDIVRDIVERIKFEHDEPEHGVSWRTVSIGIVDTADWYVVIEWKYRVRDSY